MKTVGILLATNAENQKVIDRLAACADRDCESGRLIWWLEPTVTPHSFRTNSTSCRNASTTFFRLIRPAAPVPFRSRLISARTS